MIYCAWGKNNAKDSVGLEKIPKKYNRKAKLHGVMKSIINLGGWKRIITEMGKGKKSPTDLYIEEILHDCVDVLKEAKNHEARRLTGLARDLLLFLDLGEALIMDEGLSMKITKITYLCLGIVHVKMNALLNFDKSH